MQQLNPNYVTDSANKKVAVQLSLETFHKIEEVLENYSLYHLMADDDISGNKMLNLDEARTYYEGLKKKK